MFPCYGLAMMRDGDWVRTLNFITREESGSEAGLLLRHDEARTIRDVGRTI